MTAIVYAITDLCVLCWHALPDNVHDGLGPLLRIGFASLSWLGSTVDEDWSVGW